MPATHADADAPVASAPAGDGEKPPAGEAASGETAQDDAISQLRRRRGPDAAAAEFDDVLREAIGRLGAEGRLSAAHTIVNFHGGVDVGGDIAVGGRGRRRRRDSVVTGPLDVGAELRHFVPPPDFAAAATLLDRTGLVILVGPESTGKHFAALGLAARSPKAIYYVHSRASLDDVAAVSFEAGSAYVMPDVPTTLAGAIDDGWLLAVARRLHDAGSRLILTTTQELRAIRASRRAQHVVAPFAPPPLLEIVSTLAASGWPPGAAATVAELLDVDEVREVAARLHAPSAAAAIAEALVEIAAGDDPESALAALRDVRPRVDEWFAATADVTQRSFAIAAAVLDGASYAAVADAAVDLSTRITRPAKPPADLSFRAALADHPSWIDVVTELDATAYGLVPVEAVRLADRGLQSAILRYAFDNLDSVRQPLIDWLYALGSAPQPSSVQARTAAFTGRLAEWDLPYALHHLVLPWARSRDAQARRSAALALTVCGSVATHARQIWELLSQWCVGDDVELVRTAVNVFAGTLASGSDADARAAMSRLRWVADNHPWDLLPDTAVSVSALAGADRLDVVLAELISWTEQAPESGAHLNGLLCFLTVAEDCGDARPGAPWWPALLTADARQLSVAGRLWARALATKAVRPYALEVLRGWFDLVDDLPEGMPQLQNVVRSIGRQSDRDAERLAYWLHRWATDARRPSSTADDLYRQFGGVA